MWNRIDWLAAAGNEVPFTLATEELMGVEAPLRAQYLRTIFHEMGRIAHLTMFLGDMGVQIGALTPMFYAMRDREFVLNQTESVRRGRFHSKLNRIGVRKDDLPTGWIEETSRIRRRRSEEHTSELQSERQR